MTDKNFEDAGCLASADHKVYYARKKGKSHVEKEIVCQDYCLMKKINDEVTVITVADGHGGEAYIKSDIGARKACEVFANLVFEIYQNSKKSKQEDKVSFLMKEVEFKDKYIEAWENAVLEDFKANDPADLPRNQIIRQYGTTLLFVVVTSKYYVAGQLGDGAILFFNNDGQSQLFKRHGLKTSSKTSSLASGRAKYAFLVDYFPRNLFCNILLSTDGIYDRLDSEDSFLLYGTNLVRQADEFNDLQQPFSVKDIDVSEISKDDCTVALIVSKVTEEHSFPNGQNFDYKDITFIRAYDGIEIYSAIKSNVKYEIHVVDEVDNNSENSVILEACHCVLPVEILPLEAGKRAYVYENFDGALRIKELIEHGEQLEKRYRFNDESAEEESNDIEAGDRFSNEFWLGIYEAILNLGREMKEKSVSLRGFFAEVMFVSSDMSIHLLSDALVVNQKEEKNSSLKRCLDYFSIFGKLCCGKTEIPLFKSVSQGQNISMLHILPTNKPLCRVIYNKEKKIFGLWNVSDENWLIRDEKKREIAPQGVLRLNRDHSFWIKCKESELASGVELEEGFVKYQVVIF